MTTKEAKKIPITDLLGSLGYFPIFARKDGNELWYCSPFRKEKEPSFKITISYNSWYDFGQGKGGSIIDFVQQFNNFDLRESYEYLSKHSIVPMKIDFQNLPTSSYSDVELRSIKELANPALCQYLNSRAINLEIAKAYIKEVYYRNGTTNYFALGMENNSNGYEVRSSIFKGCILAKDVTLILSDGSTSVSIFEGFIDFLSLLSEKNISILKSNVIILHSTALIQIGISIIKEQNFKTVFAFLDNDQVGKRALDTLRNELEITVKDMSYLYEGYKDLNEMRMAN